MLVYSEQIKPLHTFWNHFKLPRSGVSTLELDVDDGDVNQ